MRSSLIVLTAATALGGALPVAMTGSSRTASPAAVAAADAPVDRAAPPPRRDALRLPEPDYLEGAANVGLATYGFLAGRRLQLVVGPYTPTTACSWGHSRPKQAVKLGAAGCILEWGEHYTHSAYVPFVPFAIGGQRYWAAPHAIPIPLHELPWGKVRFTFLGFEDPHDARRRPLPDPNAAIYHKTGTDVVRDS